MRVIGEGSGGQVWLARNTLGAYRAIKIVLRACRAQPVRRFRSAEELLSALLSFHFATSELHREEAHRFWSRLVGLAGLLACVGFSTLCLCRSADWSIC